LSILNKSKEPQKQFFLVYTKENRNMNRDSIKNKEYRNKHQKKNLRENMHRKKQHKKSQ